MTQNKREQVIRPWIDPEEWVTVQCLDATDLNAEVTGCHYASVTLSLETHVSHMNHHREELRDTS